MSFQCLNPILTGRASKLARPVYSLCSLRSYSKYAIKENDVVLLQKKGDNRSEPFITKPLQFGQRIDVPHETGSIHSDDIIGKTWRDVVVRQHKKKKDTQYRIFQPSLADYTRLSPRIVTPIYPQDANLIVSLLDLNPETPSESNAGERLEIFEAGTGHGALTLHLARAIHAANPHAPPIPPSQRFKPENLEATENDIEAVAPPKSVEEIEAEKADDTRTIYDAWRQQRRAVIHTLDNNASHSNFARKVVRNFRHGLYFPHIDFHIGSIEGYIAERITKAGDDKPFLDHAILDLPGPHEYMTIVGKALKSNGSLLTWSPSLTQIMKCITTVKDQNLPFLLESVLEMGAGVGVGGKEWDVRAVKPRALLKAEAIALEQTGDAETTPEDADLEGTSEAPTSDSSSGWEMICRPKVGLKISGGGFVGLWRRMEQQQ